MLLLIVNVVAEIGFCDFKFSDINSKALNAFIVPAWSLSWNLMRKALILLGWNQGMKAQVLCFDSVASLHSTPLGGGEDQAVEELGKNTHRLFSSGSIGWHQAVISFIVRYLGDANSPSAVLSTGSWVWQWHLQGLITRSLMTKWFCLLPAPSLSS